MLFHAKIHAYLPIRNEGVPTTSFFSWLPRLRAGTSFPTFDGFKKEIISHHFQAPGRELCQPCFLSCFFRWSGIHIDLRPRFPCITPGARCKRYGGHSARVGKIRFSFEEKTVLSSGLIDGLVIQWRSLPLTLCCVDLCKLSLFKFPPFAACHSVYRFPFEERTVQTQCLIDRLFIQRKTVSLI